MQVESISNNSHALGSKTSALQAMSVSDAVQKVCMSRRPGSVNVAVPSAQIWGGEPALSDAARENLQMLTSAMCRKVAAGYQQDSAFDTLAACKVLRRCAELCAEDRSDWYFKTLGRAMALRFVVSKALLGDTEQWCDLFLGCSEEAVAVWQLAAVGLFGTDGQKVFTCLPPPISTMKPKLDDWATQHITPSQAQKGVDELVAKGVGKKVSYIAQSWFDETPAALSFLDFWKATSPPKISRQT